MARFAATLATSDSVSTLRSLGAIPQHSAGPCALGRLPEERPGDGVGPFHGPDNLIACGEVSLYNRASLLNPLVREGFALPHDAPDGQVLLAAYAHWGADVWQHAEGIFALAIWDGRSLHLVRDAVGGRTLFYACVGGTWVAASSLRALRRWPALIARPNLVAVRNFLTFAYVPGRDTLLDGVYELLPGTSLSLDLATRPDAKNAPWRRFWEPAEQLTDSASASSEDHAHYAAELRQHLKATTQACLPADDPVGVFLSGGLDSSIITALAAKHHPQPVYTYAINFGRQLPNELAFSGMVARHCQTRHRVLTFSGRQIAAGLAETVALLDCPVGDPLTVPNLLLTKAAAADGLRVILNGEGGDPCFGGPKNIPMLAFEWHRQNADPLARAQAYLRSYRKVYSYLDQVLTPDALAALAGTSPPEDQVMPYLTAPHMPHYLNKLMYANVRLKGAHHILTKVERLTASQGLEGRSPLFTRQIVDYAFAIPPQYKLAGTNEKWILKEASRDLLPQSIIDRPKSGMRVPVQHWLHGPLRRLSHEVLLGRRARERGMLNQTTVRRWLRGEGLLWPRHGALIWILLTLELWLQTFVDQAEAPRTNRAPWDGSFLQR